MTRSPRCFHTVLAAAALFALAACDPPTPPEEVPILEPEPAGAPTDAADGRLGCLGTEPAPPSGPNLPLPGWVRTLDDPTNAGGAQPSAQVEAFDEDGLSLGAAFSNTDDGRVSVTVPVSAAGFTGKVVVTADGFLDQHFFSSRPYTSTSVAGWTWLFTADQRDTMATDAGITLDAGAGLITGAVHDCDVFGVANAVVTWDGRTDGVVYLDGFALDPARTYSAASGRFAIAGVPAGLVVLEAWGRSGPGEPLELLSQAEVEVVAGAVTAVALEPRVGATR